MSANALGWLAGAAAVALAVAAAIKADGYQIYILALIGTTAIVGVGLNILVGLNGLISLGHAAFYAIGAYAVGILTTRLAWSFWSAIAAAIAISAAAGAALALPALRVRGPYLAMVTIAFGFVVEQGLAEWKDLTGGWNGLLGIEMPAAFGHAFSERDHTLMIGALTVAALAAFARLRPSPLGRAMRAVRDAEIAAQSTGLNPLAVRTIAFTLSAALTGLAGGLIAPMTGFISPESFPFSQSILFLLVVMVGGAETVLGPLVGALVIVLLPELLSTLAQYRLLFVGLLFLVVLRLAPEGIVGLVTSRFRRAFGDVPAPGSHEMAELPPPLAPAALAARDLVASFGGVKAVRGVDFAAEPGRITSLIGPNGAGKSTVLNLFCGFYKPDSGSITLEGREIAGLSARQAARLGIARTFQTTQLFGKLSVLDNVLVAFGRGRLSPLDLFRAGRAASDVARAQALLAFVGYAGDLHAPGEALAHVDKRLVEIARALALRPGVLALDEPAAGLSAEDKTRLGRLLRRIASSGVAVVLVEHDMALVMSVSDRIAVLDAGEKIAEGSPASVSDDPAVIRAYLGSAAKESRAARRRFQAGGEIVLAATALSSGYGPIGVIADLDISVEQGELVAIMGANGAGKSTLVRALAGLNRPIGGTVSFAGAGIQTLPADRIAALGLVLVPEGRQVFPEMSVIDNLALGAFARGGADADARREALLDRFPRLRERARQKAGLLSGGEQQMLAIARGLMAEPRLLILDEPSLGLAPRLIDTLYDVIAELSDEGVTILLVDQMAALALSVADRGYALQGGRVVASGTGAELMADRTLADAYLGAPETVAPRPLETHRS